MKRAFRIVFGLACLFALGFCVLWRPGPEWQDGRYRLYAMDGGRRLGLYADPGYFGLISEVVVAVGSDKRWVVAEQAWKGERHFYIMEKPRGKEFPADPEGPFTRDEYDKEVVIRGLPPFVWRDED